MPLAAALLACAMTLSLGGPAVARDSSTVDADARGILARGVPVIVLAAGFDYVRCPRGLWEDRMRRLQRAGVNALAAIVPWNWHERERGSEDFADLVEWLDLAERMGFMVIARPGPYVDSGWNSGGLPAWLSGDGVAWRTGAPASLRWSKRWYKSVMPQLAAHQADRGGPVMLVQLDAASAAPDEEYAEYLEALATAARRRGIRVPLVACLPAGTNAPSEGKAILGMVAVGAADDPVSVERALGAHPKRRPVPFVSVDLRCSAGLRGSADLCRSPDLRPSADLRRRAEREGPPVPAVLDAMLKTAIMTGASAVEIDPGFAGVAPGYWEAQDYWDAPHPGPEGIADAPVAETGTLSPTWMPVKLLGDFLGTWGTALAALPPETGGRSSNRAVAVRVRGSGPARIVMARNDTARSVTAEVALPGSRSLEVSLRPRQAKLLVAGAEAAGLAIDRLGAQPQAVVRQGDRVVLLLADEPGTWPVSARVDGEPVSGTARWDEGGGLTVIGRSRGGASSRSEVRSAGNLAVWGQPPALAASTWVIDTSRGPAIVSTGGPLLRHWEERAGRLSLEVDALPGRASLRVLLPGGPARLVEVPCWTRKMPLQPEIIRQYLVTAEKPGQGSGWEPIGALAPLGELGRWAEGFYRWRARFTWSGEGALSCVFGDEDPHWVLVNGTVVPALSGRNPTGIAELGRHVKSGENTIEALFENRGWSDRPGEFGSAKGLLRAVLLPARRSQSATALRASGISGTVLDETAAIRIGPWELAPRLARAWEHGDTAEWVKWRPGQPLPKSVAEGGPVTWFRAKFDLTSLTGWQVAWKLVVRSRWDTRVFLNGIQIASTAGGETPSAVFLADSFLRSGALANELAIAVLRGDGPASPISASIEPCLEVSTYTQRIEVPFPKP